MFLIMKNLVKKYRKLITIATIVFACLIVLIILFFYGIIRINTPSTSEYPVRGIDVSSYQGEIDWETISKNNIQFAFIKATEGSSFVDDNFQVNYQEAKKTNLRIGAYHFFSYDSSGINQAQNYIAIVPKTADMLPPVIDIEFYGDKEKNLPQKDKVQKELNELLQKLQQHYGKKPIIYATQKSYKLFILDDYLDYDIWIRDVFFTPTLPHGRKFVFWQYSDKGRLNGFNGKEKFIDMNVFIGSQEEFDNYANNKC